MRSIEQVTGSVGLFPGFDAARGLSASEVAESRSRSGGNALTPVAREPLWRKFLAKFDEPIIHILLAAALLSTVVDLFKGSQLMGIVGLAISLALVGPGFAISSLRSWVPTLMLLVAALLCGLSFPAGHPSYEGLAVMVAVVLATGVAFLSELQSDREFEALNATRDRIRPKVRREGRFQTVGIDEIVVGDLVMLEAGDEIPADGRLLTAVELSVDQSLMTGESEPVTKGSGKAADQSDGPEHPACVYRGTQVVDGVGSLLVCEVGDSTMVGQIARSLAVEDFKGDESDEGRECRVRQRLTVSKRATPLQIKLKHLADMITWAGYAAAGLIFFAMVSKAWIEGEFRDSLSIAGAFLSAIVYAVIVVVVAVPEGLPMSVTVSLAMAMRKMTRANSLVRQLVACETIGSATVICSDKTGTLTQNRMTVVRLCAGGPVVDRGGPGWLEMERSARRVHEGGAAGWMAFIAAVNSTAEIENQEGRRVVVGNGTEGALLHWLEETKVDYAEARTRSPILYQAHFSSDRKRMTTVTRQGAGAVVLVKGAAEIVLGLCSRVINEAGETRGMTSSDREGFMAEINKAAGASMRTLAFAFRVLAPEEPTDMDGLHARREDLEKGLVFAGFVAIQDPLRDDVSDALRACKEAGIAVKMVTGDNVETASAIGREIGLLKAAGGRVITSAEFQAMPDPQAREAVGDMVILARARPLDKLRLVRLLQERGEVVAVTGDGTNDAPALKRADVGLAMGLSGTEVAKEASKIVLLDDAFSTIVKAVHWGRALYENIQRFIQFQLTINVSALVIAFAAPFMGIRPPFTVLQLLWINVIMDTFASIALCSEPPRPGLMREKPKSRDEGILTSAMWVSVLGTASFYVVALLALLWVMRGTPSAPGFLGETGPDIAWMVEVPGGHVERLPAGEIPPEGKALFTMRQATVFFTVYVMFQVWNMFNCRSVTGGLSGLSNLGANPNLLLIAGIIVFFQVILVTFLSPVFHTEPLSLWDWGIIATATSSVLLLGEVASWTRKGKTA